MKHISIKLAKRMEYLDNFIKEGGNRELYDLWIKIFFYLPVEPVEFTSLPLQKYVHSPIDFKLLNTEYKENEMKASSMYTTYPNGKIFKSEKGLFDNSILVLSYTKIKNYIIKGDVIPVLSYSPPPFDVVFISFILRDESVRNRIYFGKTPYYYKSDDGKVIYSFLEEGGIPKTMGTKNDNHFIWARTIDNILHVDNPDYKNGFRASIDKYDNFFNIMMKKYIDSDSYILKNITVEEFYNIEKFL
jgi:hypothetical protein